MNEMRAKIPPHRKTLFFLSSISLFSFFFVYDSPSPMYPGLVKMFGPGYSSSHSLLYSAYALPNLLLPILLNGFFRRSCTKMMVYTYSLMVLGQSVFYLGVISWSFEMMVAGRFIIGLGGESFSVAQNQLISSLFKNHEYGSVFSCSLAIARLGTIASYLLLGSFVSYGVPVCAMLGLVLILFGGFFCLIADSILVTGEDAEKDCEEVSQTNHHLLPHVLGVTILVACAVSPFYSSNSAILQKRLDVPYPTASRLLAVQEGISLVFTVVISALTDRRGHRLSSIGVGTLFLTAGHFLICASSNWKYLPSVLIGLSSGFLACCWPCIPLLISPRRLSTGLSLLSCGVNLAYTLCPWAVSNITDPEFKISEIYTTAVSFSVFLLAVYIIWKNAVHGYGLNGTRHIIEAV